MLGEELGGEEGGIEVVGWGVASSLLRLFTFFFPDLLPFLEPLASSSLSFELDLSLLLLLLLNKSSSRSLLLLLLEDI